MTTRLATESIKQSMTVRPASPDRVLFVEVEHDGDPVRFARIVSARVNNTRMSLFQVHVGTVQVFPVMDEGRPMMNRRALTFVVRDANATLDSLLADEVVEIVSSLATTLTVHRQVPLS